MSLLHQAIEMPQWTWSSLVQVMACRLFGAKPLPELIKNYCWLDPKEPTPVKFEWKHKNIYFKKKHLNMGQVTKLRLSRSWFCYQLITKPGNKTAAVLWPDPYVVCKMSTIFFWYPFHSLFFHHNPNMMKVPIWSSPNSNKGTATKFGTCHDTMTIHHLL